jgi:hypothetical protein
MKALSKTYASTGLAVLVALMPMVLHGQIKVFDNGNVGIKYTTNTPLSKLVFNTQGNSSYDVHFYSGSRSSSGGTFFSQIETTTGTAYHIYGMIGQSNLESNNYLYGVRGGVTNAAAKTSGRAYGVYGIAGNATSGFNYGVYGYLYGLNNGAAVYGTSAGDVPIPGKYAGYFNGNIHITGSIWYATNLVTSSDENLKTNITSLKAVENKGNFFALNPVKYNLKQLEIISKDSITVKEYYDKDSDFFKKAKYGFIAQDLKELYPDLVFEGADGILGIDYIGLIPIIVNTMQEQQRKIRELEDLVQNLLLKIDEKKLLNVQQ